MSSAILLLLAWMLLPAYLLGSVPFGLLLARIRGIDIREHGSRNIGATNVWRVVGPKWGAATFFLDAAKGFVAVRLAQYIAAQQPAPAELGDQYMAYCGVFAALACLLGHSFPVWLKFKGGKGVATSLGILVSLMPPVATGLVVAVWIAIFAISRTVSLASLCAALTLPVSLAVLLRIGELDGTAYFAFACAAAFLVVRRHRENIHRIFAGTEPRFGSKSVSSTDSKPS